MNDRSVNNFQMKCSATKKSGTVVHLGSIEETVITLQVKFDGTGHSQISWSDGEIHRKKNFQLCMHVMRQGKGTVVRAADLNFKLKISNNGRYLLCLFLFSVLK